MKTIRPTLVGWLFAPEWLTLAEAKALSGHDEALLLELLEDGAIAGRQDGETWQVEKASLREYQEALFDLYTPSE